MALKLWKKKTFVHNVRFCVQPNGVCASIETAKCLSLLAQQKLQHLWPLPPRPTVTATFKYKYVLTIVLCEHHFCYSSHEIKLNLYPFPIGVPPSRLVLFTWRIYYLGCNLFSFFFHGATFDFNYCFILVNLHFPLTLARFALLIPSHFFSWCPVFGLLMRFSICGDRCHQITIRNPLRSHRSPRDSDVAINVISIVLLLLYSLVSYRFSRSTLFIRRVARVDRKYSSGPPTESSAS